MLYEEASPGHRGTLSSFGGPTQKGQPRRSVRLNPRLNRWAGANARGDENPLCTAVFVLAAASARTRSIASDLRRLVLERRLRPDHALPLAAPLTTSSSKSGCISSRKTSRRRGIRSDSRSTHSAIRSGSAWRPVAPRSWIRSSTERVVASGFRGGGEERSGNANASIRSEHTPQRKSNRPRCRRTTPVIGTLWIAVGVDDCGGAVDNFGDGRSLCNELDQ